MRSEYHGKPVSALENAYHELKVNVMQATANYIHLATVDNSLTFTLAFFNPPFTFQLSQNTAFSQFHQCHVDQRPKTATR